MDSPLEIMDIISNRFDNLQSVEEGLSNVMKDVQYIC